MSYSKEIKKLSEEQAKRYLLNLVSSEYFKKYNCNTVDLSFDLFRSSIAQGFGRNVASLKVADITDIVTKLLTMPNSGSLKVAFLVASPSAEMMQTMKFEPGVYENELGLSLTFGVTRAETIKHTDYRFNIVNLGLKKSFFASQELSYAHANARVNAWYKEVSKNLQDLKII